MGSQAPLYLIHIHCAPQLTGEGSDGFIINPTGYNMAEIIESGIDIQRKAVHGHPSAATHAHRTYLAGRRQIGIQPDTCIARIPSSFDPIICEKCDDRFLQRAEIQMNIREKIVQVQNGITYQLTGTMIGDVSSPIDLIKDRIMIFQALLIQQQVIHFTAFTEGIHVRVFHKDQVIFCGDGSALPAILHLKRYRSVKDLLLPIPGLLVIQHTPILKNHILVLHIRPPLHELHNQSYNW